MARKTRHGDPLKILLIAVTLIFCVLIGLFFKSAKPQVDTSKDFVKIIDVGQAECILIYSNGQTALIDAGLDSTSGDVAIALQEYGIKELDVLLISHLHSDHSGGVPNLFDIFSVKNLILPELSVNSEGMSHAQFAINAVTKSGGEVFNGIQGMNFEVGEFEVTILASYGEMDDENNRSIVAVAEIDGRKFMFTGDAETKVENRLLNEGLDLDCDVLKVGHHGSSTSSSEKFINAVRPRYAAISCGKDNMYGHPHNEVLAMFERKDISVLRTDIVGDITFYVEDGKISVQTEK